MKTSPPIVTFLLLLPFVDNCSADHSALYTLIRSFRTYLDEAAEHDHLQQADDDDQEGAQEVRRLGGG